MSAGQFINTAVCQGDVLGMTLQQLSKWIIMKIKSFHNGYFKKFK